MKSATLKTAIILLFFIFPLVSILVGLSIFWPIYSKSSNPITLKFGQDHPASPPLGHITINLTFTKLSLGDDWYSLELDLTSDCNQTTNVTYAFYDPAHRSYQLMTTSMIKASDKYVTFGTESFEALYLRWEIFSKIRTHLETFTPRNFPVDIYVTPNIILAFDTEGSNSTFKFLLNQFILNFELPQGFLATISNYKILSPGEVESELGSSPGLSNSLAVRFRITALRDSQSLILFSVYLVVPLLGLWCVLTVTQFWCANVEDRMKIYVGAMLASFAYLLNTRNYLPPTFTWMEISIVGLIGIWGFIELVRGFKALWTKYSKDEKKTSNMESPCES